MKEKSNLTAKAPQEGESGWRVRAVFSLSFSIEDDSNEEIGNLSDALERMLHNAFVKSKINVSSVSVLRFSAERDARGVRLLLG